MTNSEAQKILSEAEAGLAFGPLTGADAGPELSPDEYLLRALEGHIGGERTSLGQYRDLAQTTKDPVVALIMGIVLEDEERHHGLMRSIAARIKDDLYWAQSADALPATVQAPADAAAYESLRRFIASERTGVHELQNFAGQADGLYGGLITELLEMMVMDSQKHEHLLRFLFRRIGGAMAEARQSD